jgi:hypothetical protein
MSSTTVEALLDVMSVRLKIQEAGITNPSESVRDATKLLVAKLSKIDGKEQIEIDAEQGREPLDRYIRISTGEILVEISGQPNDSSIQ